MSGVPEAWCRIGSLRVAFLKHCNQDVTQSLERTKGGLPRLRDDAAENRA